MDPIEYDASDRAKATLVLLIIFFVLVCGLIVLWKLFEAPAENNNINGLLSRCREDAGVIVEGVNESENGAVNHFAICVPYEALTCIDVE